MTLNLQNSNTNQVNQATPGTPTHDEKTLDIIGDVHGYASELKSLLTQMGYQQNQGIWHHPERKAVFAGDFTCRGPSTRESIEIVRNMVENQTAYAILGNHELNVIGHFTKNKEGLPFKKATGSNKKIMDQIKAEYQYEKEALKSDIKWLRKLPFSFERRNLRVIHAYWSDENLKLISEARIKRKLTKNLLTDIFSKDAPLAVAVRQTTRGIEINLPHDLLIKDSNNIRRTNFRIQWWENPVDKTFREISYGNKFILPNYTVPRELLFPFEIYHPDKPLVFFGHYCIKQEQMTPAPNVCCLDNCVANGGQLAAYRWGGESTIKEEHFVFQEKKQIR